MSQENPTVGLAEIEAARQLIAPTILRTQIRKSESLSAQSGTEILLKLEHHQRTGSFKLRGATNAVLRLTKAERAKGVVTVSTGNHGRGLAYAARQNGVACTICMTGLVPKNKVDGIKALGAEVRIVGTTQDEAELEVERLVAEKGMTMVSPFDHPDIIAGQGTLGLEILEEVPDLETAIVQLSGGGLISGVAAAIKARKRDVRIIGVSMDRGAAMYECLKAGKPIHVEEEKTLADALPGGIGLDNKYTFAMTRDLVDDVVLVSEREIAEGVRHAYWQESQIIEGSGAVGIAALLAGKIEPRGKTVVMLSGGNIDLPLHYRIISGEDVDVTKEK